jgi:hypothetical protein
MPSASIQIADQRTSFRPREKVTGKVSWQLDHAPRIAELRLTWRAQGRGQMDFDVVETIPFSDLQAMETHSFAFTLPDAPYSFSGTLIHLSWALELEIQPGNVTESLELVVAPDGKPVSVSSVKAS